MKNFLFPALCVLLLSACAPHPGTGVWKAKGENSLGIPDLTMAFDGKARFTSSTNDPATWHCFWNASGKQIVKLGCTPSTDTEKEEYFVFTVREDGFGELSQNGNAIGLFMRGDKKPVIP